MAFRRPRKISGAPSGNPGKRNFFIACWALQCPNRSFLTRDQKPALPLLCITKRTGKFRRLGKNFLVCSETIDCGRVCPCIFKRSSEVRQAGECIGSGHLASLAWAAMPLGIGHNPTFDLSGRFARVLTQLVKQVHQIDIHEFGAGKKRAARGDLDATVRSLISGRLYARPRSVGVLAK